jgi:hypothetical protein
VSDEPNTSHPVEEQGANEPKQERISIQGYDILAVNV